MKNFNKKIPVFIFFLVVVICISIYFFTKDNSENIILEDDFYNLPNTNNENQLSEEIIVHIDGEILKPGVVYLNKEARILDAINKSGGLTDYADISKINLAYKLKDGQKIYIPSIYDEEEISYIQEDAGNNIIIDENISNSNIININSANQKELESLPGVGTSTALKIIDYRNKNGNFEKIEDIMNVSGIGEAKFNALKDYICI